MRGELGMQAALIFLVYPFLLVARIRNEERVLCDQLPGYRDYQKTC